MSIRSFFTKFLSGNQEPTEPAKSVFGADASRQREEEEKAKEWEMMVEKDRGLRGGF